MSAPPFLSAPSLAADLRTLGYPDSHQPTCIQPSHPARLHTLHYLAQQISPDTAPPDPHPDCLARFFNTHGLQTHPPSSGGYHVPLTVPTDKPRDRHLANAFLRSAIDLAMACRRRRQLGLEVMSCERGEVWTSEDLENDSVLSGLIEQRGDLFPSSVGMFGRVEPKRRKILATRKGGGGVNGRDKGRRMGEAGKMGEKGREGDKLTAYTREEIVELIRRLNRESQDLERQKEEKESAEEKEGDAHSRQQGEQVSVELVEKISTECQVLEGLVREFERVVGDAMQESREEEVGLRDKEDERKVNEAAEECETLRAEVDGVFEIAGRMRAAMGKVHRGWREIEAFQYGQVMKRVTAEKERVTAQLGGWDGK